MEYKFGGSVAEHSSLESPKSVEGLVLLVGEILDLLFDLRSSHPLIGYLCLHLTDQCLLIGFVLRILKLYFIFSVQLLPSNLLNDVIFVRFWLWHFVSPILNLLQFHFQVFVLFDVFIG